MRHLPDMEMHTLPWTKISSSASVACLMARISDTFSSRARMTRDTPSLFQAFTARAFTVLARAQVHGHARRQLGHEVEHAQVGHDHGVHARVPGPEDDLREGLELGVVGKGVQGEVDPELRIHGQSRSHPRARPG